MNHKEMQERLYQIYKAQRQFLFEAHNFQMSYQEYLFYVQINENCCMYDRYNMDFWDRWQREKGIENEHNKN